MEIANVIVTHPDNGIVSIDSFAVVDSQLRDDVVEEAEEAFIQKCVELTFGTNDSGTDRNDIRERNFYREEVSECLDDGYVEVGESLVSLVWSYVENVQL